MLKHGAACAAYPDQPVSDGHYESCTCHNAVPHGPTDRQSNRAQREDNR